MRPDQQKLLELVNYYETRARDARETLRIAEVVLPKLRKSLEELGLEREDEEALPEATPAVERADELPSEGVVPAVGAIPPLRGRCEAQVEAALGYKPGQSCQDLEEFLGEHGDRYSRGAIDLALRHLKERGRIRQARKVGNTRYWELVPETAPQGSPN